MTHIYSTEILFGVKDENMKLTSGLQQETNLEIHQFRASLKDNSTIAHDYRKVLTLSTHLNKLPNACVHCAGD